MSVAVSIRVSSRIAPFARVMSCIAVVTYASGCVRINQDEQFQDVRTRVSQLNAIDIQWQHEEFPNAQAVEEIQAHLRSGLTADSALRIALVNNAELQAEFEKFGVTQAMLVQGGLLQNPRFEAEVHFTGSGIGTATNLNLIEEIMHIVQLPMRRHIAEEALAAAKFELIASIQDFIARVRSSFYSYQSAAAVLELQKQNVRAAKATVEIANQLRTAGNTPDSNPVRARLDLADVESETDTLELNAIEAREKLQVLLGVWGPNTEWTLAEQLPSLPPQEVSWQTLVSRALENRPDLQQLQHEVAAAGGTAEMTRAFRLLPEFELGVDFEGENHGRVLPGPNFGFPLPLFNQGQTQTAAETGKLRQLERLYFAKAVTVRSEVRLGYARLVSARSRALRYQTDIKPLRQDLLEKTQLEFNAMHIGVENLLKERARQTQAEQAGIQALRDYWLARVELEKAIGGSILPMHLTPDDNETSH